MLRMLFFDHPRSIEESYLTHQRHAFRFGVQLVAAGLACFVHGLVPAFFKTNGSQAVNRLYKSMVVNRSGLSSLVRKPEDD